MPTRENKAGANQFYNTKTIGVDLHTKRGGTSVRTPQPNDIKCNGDNRKDNGTHNETSRQKPRREKVSTKSKRSTKFVSD